MSSPTRPLTEGLVAASGDALNWQGLRGPSDGTERLRPRHALSGGVVTGGSQHLGSASGNWLARPQWHPMRSLPFVPPVTIAFVVPATLAEAGGSRGGSDRDVRLASAWARLREDRG